VCDCKISEPFPNHAADVTLNITSLCNSISCLVAQDVLQTHLSPHFIVFNNLQSHYSLQDNPQAVYSQNKYIKLKIFQFERTSSYIPSYRICSTIIKQLDENSTDFLNLNKKKIYS
jgi:hypothetical protein